MLLGDQSMPALCACPGLVCTWPRRVPACAGTCIHVVAAFCDAHLRAVGGSDKQHTAVGRGGIAAVHLDQHLCLQPPAGFMLACTRQDTHLLSESTMRAG